MKRSHLLLLALAGFVVWQWFLNRRKSDASQHLAEQEQLQRLGQIAGNAQIRAFKPASPAPFIGAADANGSPIDPMVRPDGTVVVPWLKDWSDLLASADRRLPSQVPIGDRGGIYF